MALREELEHQGNWLFRWRSYLPLLLLPALAAAMPRSEGLERALGDRAGDCYEAVCVAVSLLGLAIRCLTVGHAPGGTSGRNTRQQRAATLNTTGMYSLMRHPLYFGNTLILLGIACFVQVWWFALLAVLSALVYYERIAFAEEEFLRDKFGQSYSDWAHATPAFWPDLRKWRRPSLPFSFRSVLQKESSALPAVVSSFTFLDIVGDLAVERKLELDLGWGIAFSVALVVYLILRFLRKWTRLLHVEGR